MVATEAFNKHQCSLPPPPDLLELSLKKGPCLGLRRWFREVTAMSEKHPDTAFYLKSMNEYRKAYNLHLTKFHTTIHPLSRFRRYFRIYEAFLLLLYYHLMPAIMCDQIDSLREMKLFFDCLFLLNIPVNFRLGLTDKAAKKIILDQPTIARSYLKSYFFIDVISSVPLDYILYLNGSREWYIMMIPSLKLLEIQKMYRNLFQLQSWTTGKNVFSPLLIFLPIYEVIVWWFACVIAVVTLNYHNPRSWFIEDKSFNLLFCKCLYRSTYTIMLVGPGLAESFFIVDVVVDILALVCGYILQFFCFAIIIKMLNVYDASKRFYQIFVEQVRQFIIFKDIPTALGLKIMQYCKAHFKRKVYKDNKYMKMLTGQLRQDIITYDRLPLLELVDFLQNVPKPLLEILAMAMKPEFFLSGDVIAKAGSIGDRMYFLKTGTVAVFSSTGKEMCHLEDNANFGEIALILNVERVANIFAISDCELYTLHRKSFQRILIPHTPLFLKIRKIILNKKLYGTYVANNLNFNIPMI